MSYSRGIRNITLGMALIFFAGFAAAGNPVSQAIPDEWGPKPVKPADYPSYVNFFWNQHQPTYIDGLTDKWDHQFTRFHAMRDYYFMAAILVHGRNDFNTYELQGNQWVDTGHGTGRGFPFVHITINLSAVLIDQIENMVNSLAPAFEGANTPDEVDLGKYPGGDPRDPNWNDGSVLFEMTFDTLCKPKGILSVNDKRYILDHSTYIKPANGHIEQWPSYNDLYRKRIDRDIGDAFLGGNPDHWSETDIRDLIVWYNLSLFHAYFRETDRYPLIGHDKEGNEMTDYVEGLKTLGGFKTWGAGDYEWFGAKGETLLPTDMGGFSGGSGESFTLYDLDTGEPILDPATGRPAECRHFTDDDCLKVAIACYKVLKYVIPVHRKLQNTVCPHDGYPQLEVVTTPYSHPILPLIYDTDTYFEQNEYYDRVDNINFKYHGDGESDPGPWGPDAGRTLDDDVYNQVALGAKTYHDAFGKYPNGMWPGEGAVGESIIYAFRRNNIKWISTGNETGEKSGHFADAAYVYRIDEDDIFLDGDNSDATSLVLRSEGDRIAFDSGYYSFGWDVDGDAKAVFVFNSVIADWSHEKFWTHCADGENAWGYFFRNGANFFEGGDNLGESGSPSYGLYYRLNRSNWMIPENDRWYKEYNLISATPSSYIGIRDGEYTADGKKPLDLQLEIEPLAHGSWIHGTLDTWIGEDNENQAWVDLKKTRADIVAAGAEETRFDPYSDPPDPKTDGRAKFFEWKLWRELYLAESSDYFWWLGADQCVGSDEIWDDLLRKHLINVYVYGEKLGYDFDYPYMQVHPIFHPTDNVNGHHPAGAEYDEDYLYDCEPPPGHGEMIVVPPLTRDPKLSLGTVPADAKTYSTLSVYVYEEGPETSNIKSVTVNLAELGGEKTAPLFDDGNTALHGDLTAGDGIYSRRVTAALGTPAGEYLLVIRAEDDSPLPGVSMNPIYSLDYVNINVSEAAPPVNNPPKILLGGFGDTYLQAGVPGALKVMAYVIDPDGPEDIVRVEIYYSDKATGLLLADDGTGADLRAGDHIYTGSFPLTAPAPGRIELQIKATDRHGLQSDPWPRLISR